MKVYIVTSGSYSDYHIDRVFTDEQQAKLYCATHANDCEALGIEEWESDEVKLDTSLEIFEKWVARFDFEGHLLNFWTDGFTFKQPNSVAKHSWRRTEYFVHVYLPDGTAEEKAKKILCDYFAKWKYEQMEVIR